MKLNTWSSFLLGYFCLMLLYWLGLQMTKPTNLPINLTYSLSLNIMSFVGGIFGIIISGTWGRFKSAVGRGIFFLGSGLASWGIGGFIWSYYNFILHQDVPYPSLSDLGFAGAVPLWILGIIFLSKATGVRLSLRKIGGRILLIIIPLIIAIFSYYVLFVIARGSSFDWQGGFLKVFLDMFYPVGDWIVLTLSIIVWGLSFQYLGGKYRWPIFITLSGFVFMYFADFLFSYTTTLNTYFNGSIADLLFTLALFTIGFGISSFKTTED